MTKVIKLVDATFDANGNATLVIPNHAESESLKFYVDDSPADLIHRIAAVLLIDQPPVIPGTHTRMFQIIPDGQPVPAEFVKYIATFPYGPTKLLVHCIEVFPEQQETGSFNEGSAIIT